MTSNFKTIINKTNTIMKNILIALFASTILVSCSNESTKKRYSVVVNTLNTQAINGDKEVLQTNNYDGARAVAGQHIGVVSIIDNSTNVRILYLNNFK